MDKQGSCCEFWNEFLHVIQINFVFSSWLQAPYGTSGQDGQTDYPLWNDLNCCLCMLEGYQNKARGLTEFCSELTAADFISITLRLKTR